jgi:RNA polymerase sigma-70 factor, ECF subfamily
VSRTLAATSATTAPEDGLGGLRAKPWSFDEVYRAHVRTVARWAMRLVGPDGEFEDVVQEVFIVVRRRLSGFRGDAEITTWLYRITMRVAARARVRARWWSWVTGRGKSPGRGKSNQTFVPPPDMPRDPQALLEARERTSVMYRVLDEIGEKNRAAFIMYEIEGLSCEQIAEVMDSNIRTVWVRLSRARHKFIERMSAWEAKEES